MSRNYGIAHICASTSKSFPPLQPLLQTPQEIPQTTEMYADASGQELFSHQQITNHQSSTNRAGELAEGQAVVSIIVKGLALHKLTTMMAITGLGFRV